MIEIAKWGKDHWSTFAYLGTLAVDNQGIAVPDKNRMRTDQYKHPHLVGWMISSNVITTKYPTRLKDCEIDNHDDWDCLDDAVEAGFLEDVGSGLHKAYKFTKRGIQVLHKLNEHKMKGGNFATFTYPIKKKEH